MRQTEWVYAKRPFAGPQQVVDYVGRYTHRVAISNDRLLDMDRGEVRFTYKDYRTDSQRPPKTMTLAAPEFIRRFLRANAGPRIPPHSAKPDHRCRAATGRTTRRRDDAERWRTRGRDLGCVTRGIDEPAPAEERQAGAR